jgi:hypothetical protein
MRTIGLGITIKFRACWLSLIMAWLVAAALNGSSARADDVILYGTTGPGVGVGQRAGRILTIDYTTGAILNSVDAPAGSAIGLGFTGSAFRQSTGQLYVIAAPSLNSNPTLYAINPATGSVDTNFGILGSSPPSSLDGLDFIGDQLYAREAANADTGILEINPNTGQFNGIFETLGIVGGSTDSAGGLAAVGDTLYVSYFQSNFNAHAIAAFSLRTATDYGQQLYSYNTPNNLPVAGLASDGTSLYAAASNGVIYRLDPTSGNVLDSRTLIDPNSGSGIVLDSLADAGSPVPLPSAAWGGGVLLIVLALVNRKGIARLFIPST